MWLILAIAGAAIWGLDYTLSEAILKKKVSPFTLNFLQLVIGVLTFLAYFAFYHFNQFKSDLSIMTKNHMTLLQVVILCVTFNLANLLIFFAIQAKNATLVGFIELSYPLFIIFFTWILFRVSHLNTAAILGGLLIIAGACCLQYAGD